MYILYYWYRQREGEGGKGGPQAFDYEGFPLAARDSPRPASPRLASKSCRLGRASRLRLPFRLRLRLRSRFRLCATMRFPEIYTSTSPFPPPGQPVGS